MVQSCPDTSTATPTASLRNLRVHALLAETSERGFNRDERTAENPFPDAWLYDCEIIRAANDCWTEETAKLAKISLLCFLPSSRRCCETDSACRAVKRLVFSALSPNSEILPLAKRRYANSI
jgi:hypothetical protein